MKSPWHRGSSRSLGLSLILSLSWSLSEIKRMNKLSQMLCLSALSLSNTSGLALQRAASEISLSGVLLTGRAFFLSGNRHWPSMILFIVGGRGGWGERRERQEHSGVKTFHAPLLSSKNTSHKLTALPTGIRRHSTFNKQKNRNPSGKNKRHTLCSGTFHEQV